MKTKIILSLTLALLPLDLSGAVITGTLAGDDSLATHFFSLPVAATVTIQTYSFGGGVTSTGTVVSAGGFDPVVSLFEEVAGFSILLGYNDDGLCPPGTVNGYCGDSTLTLDLLPGDYRIVISASVNTPVGPLLDDGFTGGGSLGGLGDGYTAEWTSVPEPATFGLGLGAMLGLVLARRRRRAGATLLLLVVSAPVWAVQRFVPSGGDLQGALNVAQLGDEVVLQAGGTYTGAFVPPAKSGSGWITIRTNSAVLLARGGRVSPADAPLMAKIVVPSAVPAFDFGPGTHHYRVIGLEFVPAAGIYPFQLLQIGTYETTASAMPAYIEIDRCYIHGDAAVGGKNGIVLSGVNVTVSNSYLAGFTSTSQETHAIVSWAGGPYNIINNYLQASGVNLLFGGATPLIAGEYPKDVRIQRNHIHKLLSWKPSDASYGGVPYLSKNLLEIKFGRRFLIDGNVLENSWFPPELGRGIVLAMYTQDGQVPWATIEDIRITRNILKNLGAGMLIFGKDVDTVGRPGLTRNVLVQDNILTGILGANSDPGQTYNSTGVFFTVHNAVENLQVLHNTYEGSGRALVRLARVLDWPVPLGPGFQFSYNLGRRNGSGVSDDEGREGTAALNAGAPTGYVFRENVIEGGTPGLYPAGNYFPAAQSEVGYANLALKDLRLTAQSPYFRRGSDGKDLGADAAAVYQATQGVVAGTGARCVTAITPSAVTVGAAGGSGVIQVTAPAGCFWMTAITPSWLRITGGWSGQGSGQVHYTVPALGGAAARGTTVVIDGWKSAITQR